MMVNSSKKSAVLAILLSASLSVPAVSAAPIPSPADTSIHNGVDEFSSVERPGGGRAGGGRAAPGPARAGGGRANFNPGRQGNFNRGPNVNVYRRGGNVAVVGRRPYRGWAHRPYYGTVLGGVVLGTIITAAIIGTAPVAPAPNMCWFWSDPSYTQGYWDYCSPPPY